MPKDDAIHEAEMLEISLGFLVVLVVAAVQATRCFLGGWKLRGKSPLIILNGR